MPIAENNNISNFSLEADERESIASRMKSLLHALCNGLYERENAVRLSLLTAIAGESIFLLGPPGVGKSLIARRLKFAFKDGTSFEYLMSKFSTPDEIFGPISIKKLKEEDKYERLTERYLPQANIVFLDEIWKAGPAIQNALLTILNEKIYRNGDKDMSVNIRGIITASNELPPPSQSLDPIWDRFLVRLEVENIRHYAHFLTMITDTNDVYKNKIRDELKLTEAELNRWNTLIDQVQVPPEVLNTIQVVKLKIEEFNAKPNHADQLIRVYDRRWKKIIRLMRTSAFLNGRDMVDLMDCFLMPACLWNKPSQLDTLKEIVSETIRNHGYTMPVNLNMVRREIADFEEDVENEIKIKNIVTEEQLVPVHDEYYELIKEDNRFEGVLITIKQFNELQLNEDKIANFYDAQMNLANRLKAQRSNTERSIDVYYNSVRYTIPLRTKKAERVQILYKKPHKIVAQYWDERCANIKRYVQSQLERLALHAPAQLNDLENNLFVDKELSRIVRANLDEVKSALNQALLQLEKIQYSYSSLD